MMTNPCGTCAALWQIPTLLMLSVAVLLTFARMSVRIQRTVKQGLGIGGVAGIWNGHPEIRYWSVANAANAPPTFTRVFVLMI
jgi:hypothetical protein